MLTNSDKIKKIINDWGLVTLVYVPFVYFYAVFFFNSFSHFYKTQISRHWIPIIAEITEVDINYKRLYSNALEKNITYINAVTKYSYKINNKIIFGHKTIPLDARGNPWSEYFENVYCKKEIIENAKLVRYDLTNQNNGIPVLYDLGEKIELIINKK